jgi:hypothetical protein
LPAIPRRMRARLTLPYLALMLLQLLRFGFYSRSQRLKPRRLSDRSVHHRPPGAPCTVNQPFVSDKRCMASTPALVRSRMGLHTSRGFPATVSTGSCYALIRVDTRHFFFSSRFFMRCEDCRFASTVAMLCGASVSSNLFLERLCSEAFVGH